MKDLPLPGEQFEGRTVVASGWHTDYIWAIMSLNDEAPYYRVDEVPLVEVDEEGDKLTRFTERFHNIVPAAQFFDEQFGLWGG
jgi:hypothetical protein